MEPDATAGSPCRCQVAWASLSEPPRHRRIREAQGTVAELSGAGCAGTHEAAAGPPPPVAGPLRLDVDATHAPQQVFRAHEVIPVRPGPLTLSYPKWIPGEHSPSGNVTNLAIQLTVNGKPLAWQRDVVDLYQFHCVVPAGAQSVEADLEYYASGEGPGAFAGLHGTEKLTNLRWHELLLYPAGAPVANVTVDASVRLPDGWALDTALPVEQQAAAQTHFQAVSLERLVDSPVVAGELTRALDFDVPAGPRQRVFLAADSAEALAVPETTRVGLARLFDEAATLFGGRAYGSYHALVQLSDRVGAASVEHHDSAELRFWERALVEPDRARLSLGVIAHELAHSWNGKYRRPAGLATPDFQQPMRGELLWVYEGLTQYLGWVLGARSGLVSKEDSLDDLAWTAAYLESTPGRLWRPLADTAVAASLLYAAPGAWAAKRRGVDFYWEGQLLWLEADVLIRRGTDGRKSLDDFCRAFFGGASGTLAVRLYDLPELVRALDQIYSYDWAAFFQARVYTATPHVPMGGITAGGYDFGYDDKPNALIAAYETLVSTTLHTSSWGARLGEGGAIVDVVPGSPADAAGVSPGMKIVAVDSRKYTPQILTDALTRAATSPSPFELLVESGERYLTRRVDYHGGVRHPHLTRKASEPDLLSLILAPRSATP